jgi:hypothetical protein
MKDKDAISEVLSEKKSRGRPPRFKSEHYETAGQFSNAKTVRGKQNACYWIRAYDHLKGQGERFSYLFEPKPRLTILAELGRVWPSNFCEVVAEEVCKQKMSTTKAVGYVRAVRKPERHPSILRLAHAIHTAIQKQTDAYPGGGFTHDEIFEALQVVSSNYNKAT